MNFSPRLRILVHQCTDAAGLGPRQILANHPPCSEIKRIFVIHRIAAGAPFRDVEMSLAVVGVKLVIHKKAWRSGMVERRTRPKNTLLLIHPLIRDAVVVSHTAARGDP